MTPFSTKIREIGIAILEEGIDSIDMIGENDQIFLDSGNEDTDDIDSYTYDIELKINEHIVGV